MKQIFQYLDSGKTKLIELPPPRLERGEVLIRSEFSLISSGTERMLINFGKSNLVSKAKSQPEKVSEVISKIKSEGIFNTLDAVSNKLDKPLPLGYCNAGIIVEVGENVTSFKVGDRVVSNGFHAELVTVSENLCALIPDEVSFEEAAFTVIAAVGLQGIRLLKPTLGETIAVSGLGIIGLITCQLLLANGCKVLGLDPDQSKCELANIFGVETFCISNESNPTNWCLSKTNGVGVDGFLVTASTSSSNPIYVAANSSRKRGRIVLVGVTGLDLKRELFYKKELTFQVSCSYGPGRYDKSYEVENSDYPIGYVRWTEKRNFEAILDLLSLGILDFKKLIEKRFDFEDALDAYKLLLEKSGSLGILLSYKNDPDKNNHKIKINPLENYNSQPTEPVLGFIGAGNYSSRTLLPAFRNSGANFQIICSLKGANAMHYGRKFSFKEVTTNDDDVFSNEICNTVIISTRHNSHAELINKALNAGKNVFVEKPLCLNKSELKAIKETLKKSIISKSKNNSHSPLLMVGYNRRFSPLITKLKKFLKNLNGPKAFIYTCNAGFLDSNHWLNDPKIGGGRFLGECCHFVDLLFFLSEEKITDIKICSPLKDKKIPETFTVNLQFEKGSIGSIHYFSNGSKLLPKERIEVFSEKTVFRLENFKKLKAWGYKGFSSQRLLTQDKGQKNCTSAFLNAIRKGECSPIPIEEIFEVQSLLLNAEYLK